MEIARHEDICSTGELEGDAAMLLGVLMGSGAKTQRDIVCLNAAPLLYVTDTVMTLNDSVEMARRALFDGSALSKLYDWVRWQNVCPEDGLPVLERMIAKAA